MLNTEQAAALAAFLSMVNVGRDNGARSVALTMEQAEALAEALRPQHESTPTAPAEQRDAWRGGSSYEASLLRNLLAVIHRDGGHYLEAHGLDKACEDAEAAVLAARA